MDRFFLLLNSFAYDFSCDPWNLRIEANSILLDAEYKSLIARGMITLEEAKLMKDKNMERVYRYYDQMKNMSNPRGE